MGKMYYYYGTMKSGKSLELFKIHYNFTNQNKKVIVFSPELNTRDNGNIVSRAMNREIKPVKINKYDSFIINCRPDVILVDEAQFLTEQQVKELKRLSRNQDCLVFLFGLKNTYKDTLFEGSKQALISADTIREIKTTCECCGKNKATENVLFNNGKIVTDGSDIVIGDTEYKAMCYDCKIELIEKLK